MKELIIELGKLSELPTKSNYLDYKKYNLGDGNEYFYLNEGKEHYQLLSYISSKFNNKLFYDIGTYRGCSALALSYNKSNTIMSYDILNHRLCNFEEPNINFILGNVLEDENIINSDLILLDTAHDGGFESHFLKFLKDKKYKGVVLMDDVNLYPVLKDLAKQLADRNVVTLVDLTNIGHFSGTLALIFN